MKKNKQPSEKIIIPDELREKIKSIGLKTRKMDPNEYSALKSEIITTIGMQQNYIIAMYTVTVAVIGYAWQCRNSWLMLLPYVILFSFQRIIDSKKYHWLKLAAILAVFSDDIWETNFEVLNGVVDVCYDKKKKKIHSLRLIRVSSLHLGLVCSLLCIVSNTTDFFSANFDFCCRIYISATSIILFLIMIIWCRTALDSMERRKDYEEALREASGK